MQSLQNSSPNSSVHLGTQSLSDTEQRIFDYVDQHPGVIAPKIAEALNLSLNGIYVHLRRIVDKIPGVFIREEVIRDNRVSVVKWSLLLSPDIGDIRLTPQEKKIYDFIQENPDHLAPEMARRLGIPEKPIHATLTRMQKKLLGILIRTPDTYVQPMTSIAYRVSRQVGDIIQD